MAQWEYDDVSRFGRSSAFVGAMVLALMFDWGSNLVYICVTGTVALTVIMVAIAQLLN
jgi:hypothetical protein